MFCNEVQYPVSKLDKNEISGVSRKFYFFTRLADSVSEAQGVGGFWVESEHYNNTMDRSRIFLSDSDSENRIESFFISHFKLGNSCWNGAISFETFVETENSCRVPQFPLIASCQKLLTAKLHSHYVKESVSESEIWKGRSWSWTFYIRLRKSVFHSVAIKTFDERQTLKMSFIIAAVVYKIGYSFIWRFSVILL